MQHAILIIGPAVNGHRATRVTPDEDVVLTIRCVADVVAEASAAVIATLQVAADGLAVDAVVALADRPCVACAALAATPVGAAGVSYAIRFADHAVAGFTLEAGAA
jgi:carbonic anhydrase